MIVGSVEIDGEAVNTHRDSYLLRHLTVVSVRRPFLAGSILFAAGFGGFAVSFADLLYPHEVRIIGGCIAVVIVAGLWVGQLKLLSRDLRGSELADVIWGSYGHMNRTRMKIVQAMRAPTQELK
jgi:hypothetical protein